MTDIAPLGIAARYEFATSSFRDFVGDFTDDDWATPVPCTPAWTARDVLSHVAGLPDDILNGRVEGAATDPWTASQVERNAEFSVAELLARLEEQAPDVGRMLEAIGEARPPFDCQTHEHDLRHALGRPGNRDNIVIASVAEEAGDSLAELDASLTIDFTDGPTLVVGAGGDEVGVSLTRFEYARSRVGRRSAAQLAAYDWSGQPDAVAAVQRSWWVFGVADQDVVE